MAKRIIVVIGLIWVVAPVFSQDFSVSAGAGGIFTMGLGGGVSGEMNVFSQTQTQNYEQTGFGGFAFIDATYAEAGAAFVGGTAIYKIESDGSAAVEIEGKFSAIDIFLLGKYPFFISDSFSLFPLVGIDYQLFLSQTDTYGSGEYRNADGEEAPGNLSALWIKAGAGADFLLTESFFVRFEFLYGIRLQNKADEDLKTRFEAQKYENVKIEMGHGPTIKLAAGYKFF